MTVKNIYDKRAGFRRHLVGKTLNKSFTHKMAAKAGWHWNNITHPMNFDISLNAEKSVLSHSQNALYNTDSSISSPIITQYNKISTPFLPLVRYVMRERPPCVCKAWQCRFLVPYLCQLVVAAILWVKLSEIFVTLLSLKYALSVG